MDMKTIALHMWPLWLLGVSMLIATYRSEHRDLIRVDKEAIKKWTGSLLLIALFRILSWKYLLGPIMGDKVNAVLSIPWQMTLTVFWEDACHTLPLVLLARFLGESIPAKVIYYLMLAMVTVSFGLGHVYQGYFAAALLSMAIPYTVKLGKKYGFGTMMLGHMLYDLTTILTLKFCLSFL